MELRRWPRKNDPASIEARQEALDGRVDPEVFGQDLTPWAKAQEALTGVSVIPTAVIGPLTISLGEYELTEPEGAVVERGRSTEDVFVPLAHTEGSMSDSLFRGARAAAESGGFRTYVLQDRITRASCFVCKSAGEALALATWIEGEVDSMRAWIAELDDPSVSRHAKLREVKTHVVGPMCHVLWRWTTGDAVGANMMTRNSYFLNMGYVMERAPVKPERALLEANMGGDKKAVVRVLPGRPREDGHRRDDADRGRDPARAAHDDRRSARAVLGRDARCRRVRDAVRGVHAGDGDRGHLRRHRPGPRDGRDELDVPRHRSPRGGGPARRACACPGSRSAPSAAAPPSPTPAPGWG